MTETTAAPELGERSTGPIGRPGRAYAASLAGTSLEYYDFAIYSISSAIVLPKIFFPADDPYVGLILSFSTFAIGYLARPLGGIIFGRLGDRIGRRAVLIVTLLMIGIATTVIGMLPGYDTIGPLAPTLLVLLRLVQGVGVGGEWGGAALLASESGSPRRRGLLASAAQLGVPVGNLLANAMLAIFSTILTPEEFLAWGWRVGFLASIVLVALGLLLRTRLEETVVFQAVGMLGEQSASPLREVMRRHPRGLFAAGLARICPDVLYALMTVFVATYATQVLGTPTATVLTAVLIGSAFQLVAIPAASVLTDYVNRRLVYAVAAVLTAAWIPVFFTMIQDGSPVSLTVGVVVGLVLHAAMYGPQAAYITEQFPAPLRYVGSSLAYTLAGVVGGAIAALMFTWIFAATQTWIFIAVYLAVTVVITLIGLALGRNGKPEEDEELVRAATATIRVVGGR